MLNLIQHHIKKIMQKSYTYILTNKYRTTFYVGVTANLKERLIQHASGMGSKFTKKYAIIDLIYYEEFIDINQAIAREKQLKNWKRDWKIDLVKELNPKLETLVL
ncbi:GIY-YIG nuclease family protein [Kordia sp.]|uniref:GIY-YIG nuclease family protein n=1 Tax=Kordia sp. TaxID=1965332 RepID=UPI003B5BA76E